MVGFDDQKHWTREVHFAYNAEIPERVESCVSRVNSIEQQFNCYADYYKVGWCESTDTLETAAVTT